MCCSIAHHSLPLFLCASARNNLLLHSVACCIVPQHNSLCRGQALHATVVFLCAMGKNHALQHLMPLFFVLQQEMMCCCIPWHCTSCCGMVHYTVALFTVLRNGASPCYCKDWWGTINLCSIGCHSSVVTVIWALLVVVFVWRLLLCCCCFCGGGDNQPVWLWLWWHWWHGGCCGWWHLGFLCFLLQHCTFLCSILWCYFCASALFYVPQHCALCHGTVFCAVGLFLCHDTVFVKQHHVLFCGNVINAMVLCFVPQPSMMCCGIVPCAAICAMALHFVPWHFCATALAMCHECCLLCHGIVLHAMALFFVPQHCAICHVAWHAAAVCVPKWFFVCVQWHCYF